jgi:hypothetical protein
VGNKRFRDAVTSSLPHYMEAESRFEKSLVVHAIVDQIRGEGGRFLKKDHGTGRWYELSRQQSKEKVGHAVRDAANSLETRRKKKVGDEDDEGEEGGVGFDDDDGADSASMELLGSGGGSRKRKASSPPKKLKDPPMSDSSSLGMSSRRRGDHMFDAAVPPGGTASPTKRMRRTPGGAGPPTAASMSMHPSSGLSLSGHSFPMMGASPMPYGPAQHLQQHQQQQRESYMGISPMDPLSFSQHQHLPATLPLPPHMNMAGATNPAMFPQQQRRPAMGIGAVGLQQQLPRRSSLASIDSDISGGMELMHRPSLTGTGAGTETDQPHQRRPSIGAASAAIAAEIQRLHQQQLQLQQQLQHPAYDPRDPVAREQMQQQRRIREEYFQQQHLRPQQQQHPALFGDDNDQFIDAINAVLGPIHGAEEPAEGNDDEGEIGPQELNPFREA